MEWDGEHLQKIVLKFCFLYLWQLEKIPGPSQSLRFYSLGGPLSLLSFGVLSLPFVVTYVDGKAAILMLHVFNLLVSEAASYMYSGKICCGSQHLDEVQERVNAELLISFLIFENEII